MNINNETAETQWNTNKITYLCEIKSIHNRGDEDVKLETSTKRRATNARARKIQSRNPIIIISILSILR